MTNDEIRMTKLLTTLLLLATAEHAQLGLVLPTDN